MERIEALKRVRALIRAAEGEDDIEAVRKLLRDMDRIAEKGIEGRLDD